MTASGCEDSGATFVTNTSKTTTRNTKLQLSSGKKKPLVAYLLETNEMVLVNIYCKSLSKMHCKNHSAVIQFLESEQTASATAG